MVGLIDRYLEDASLDGNNSTAPTITLADATIAHDRAIRAVESRVISRVYGDLSEVDQKCHA